MSALPPGDKNFFHIGGTLGVDALSYVERAADRELFEALREGEFCYVLTSRQMGKSSLMVRTAAQLRQEGTRVVVLDLTAVGTNLTAEQWYFTLLAQLGDGLGCEEEMETLWGQNPQLAPLARWTQALREVAVRRAQEPVVIFVDEIDYVRSLPFAADEFFAAIRECYNLRTRDARMRGLSFCLLGVAMPADLIRDRRMTPFNIGRAMNLADFTPAEAEPLAVGLHAELETGQRLIQRVIHWTGGQPYLTQKLCAEVRRAQVTTPAGVDEVCARVFLAPHARDRDDNLHLVQDRMLRSNVEQAELLDAYAQVCRGTRVEDDDLNPVANELRLAGIVRVVQGYLRVRNEIYRRVFDLRWVRGKMPDAEERRQRAAFYRGVRRVALVAACVVATVSALGFYAWKQKQKADHNAREAIAQKVIAEEEEAKAERFAREAQENAQRAEEQRKAARESEQRALQQERVADEQRRLAKDSEAKATESKRMADMFQREFAANITETMQLLTSVGGIPSTSVQQVLDNVKTLAEAQDEATMQLRRVDLLRDYSRLYIKFGNPDQALRRVQAAREIIEGWVRTRPNDLELKLRLVDCENTIGDAILGDSSTLKGSMTDELRKAAASFEEGLRRARELRGSHPEDARCTEAIVAVLNNLGDVQTRLGDYAAALTFFSEAGELIEHLHDAEPADAGRKERLARSHDQIGDLHFQLRTRSGTEEARRRFELSRDLRLELEQDAPIDAKLERQANLAFSFNKLGKALSQQHHADAQKNIDEAISLRKRVIEQRPSDFETKRQLAYSYDNLGDILRARGGAKNQAQAINYFRQRLEISEELYNQDRLNKNWETDYCAALNALADGLASSSTKDRWAEAETRAKQAVRLTEERNPEFLWTLARILRLRGNLTDGRAAFEKAEALLKSQGKLTPMLEELDVKLKAERKTFDKAALSASPKKKKRSR